MKVKKIKCALVKVPEVRVTAVYDEELQQLLHDSLTAMGQVQPVVVVQAGEDFLLVDGMHRLEEAKKRGDELIDAVIYEGEAVDALLKNLVLNRLRGKTKASEMVTVIHSLYNDYALTIEQIQERTGLGRDYIERMIKISSAAPSVQEALDRELIGVGHAFEISRIPSHVAQDEIMAKYQVWRWTVKEIHDQVELVLAMIPEVQQQLSQPKTHEKSVYRCEGCKTEADLRYLRAVLLCPNCFGIVYRTQQSVQPATPEDETSPKE